MIEITTRSSISVKACFAFITYLSTTQIQHKKRRIYSEQPNSAAFDKMMNLRDTDLDLDNRQKWLEIGAPPINSAGNQMDRHASVTLPRWLVIHSSRV
jgi:glutaredoxin-related protein